MAIHKTYGRDRLDKNDNDAIREVLQEAYELGKEAAPSGKVATYIPELAKASADEFGICLMKRDGSVFSYGDTETRFSMQSVSKVVSLAIALEKYGYKRVFSNVLMEPSGDSFNSIIKLDTASNLPYNPMINAGAVQIAGLIAETGTFEQFMDFTKLVCMDDDITLNRAVYNSEAETGHRNRAIAYLLKSKGVLEADVDKTLDMYFKMCSLNVNAKSLAGLGLVLANDGINPKTGQKIIHSDFVKIINSIMFTCGMYDGSGEFGVKVGIPAKSGVGGGITCGVKAHMGIGTYGPALDSKGNSVGGTTALEHISYRLNLHVFDY